MCFLYIDGAARNNPGSAGAGIYITCKNKEYRFSYYLGDKTNNQAEYLALIIGILHLKKLIMKKFINVELHTAPIVIKSDSQLLVRQLCNLYKVKNNNLKKLYQIAKNELEGLNYTIEHVRREHNTMADSLANYAVDNKVALPKSLSYIIDALDKLDILDNIDRKNKINIIGTCHE